MINYLLASAILGQARWLMSWISITLIAYLSPLCLNNTRLMHAVSNEYRTDKSLAAPSVDRARRLPYADWSTLRQHSESIRDVGLEASASIGAQEKDKYVFVKGRYYNYDYGYTVLIPKGMIGFRAPAPSPNHGFGIKLSTHPESTVWVDASYNAAEWKSFDEAIKDHLSYIKNERVANIAILKQTPARLGNLRGVRFLISYEVPDSGKMIKDIILAIRKPKKDVGVVYTIELTAPSDRYNKDKTVMAELQKIWGLKPLPK